MLSMAADFTAFTSNYDPNQTTSDPADPFLQLFQGDQTSGTPLAEDFDGAADYSTDTGMLFTAGGLQQSGGPVFDSLIQISDTTQPTGLDAGTYTLLISPTTTVNTQQPPTSGFGDFLRVNVVTQAKPSP
jgi:hypothetical protein